MSPKSKMKKITVGSSMPISTTPFVERAKPAHYRQWGTDL